MDKARIALGNSRLLALADLLEQESKRWNHSFDMGCWWHMCGTPGCALGHYSSMEEPQSRGWGSNGERGLRLPPLHGKHIFSATQAEFAITAEEHVDLFGTQGCDNADADPAKAAAYIRKFVEGRCTAPVVEG